jgi:hypothetical protein
MKWHVTPVLKVPSFGKKEEPKFNSVGGEQMGVAKGANLLPGNGQMRMKQMAESIGVVTCVSHNVFYNRNAVLLMTLRYPKHDTLVGRALDLYGEWNRDAHELLSQVHSPAAAAAAAAAFAAVVLQPQRCIHKCRRTVNAATALTRDFQVLRAGDTVVDAGAGFGVSALVFSKVVRLLHGTRSCVGCCEDVGVVCWRVCVGVCVFVCRRVLVIVCLCADMMLMMVLRWWARLGLCTLLRRNVC